MLPMLPRSAVPVVAPEPTGPKPALLGPDGRPMVTEDGTLLPQYRTFAGVWNSAAKVYRYTWDEALKHDVENALSMKRDIFIQRLLRERRDPVAQFDWHLDPENPKDAGQVAVADGLTQVVKRTPHWRRFLKSLLWATWYGRYGCQLVWDKKTVLGQPRVCVTRHQPVNGDKIQFQWDGTPVLFLNSGEAKNYPDDAIVITDRAMGLKLNRPEWRDRIVIHKFEPDDADFFQGEMAGGVHGVGIRSRIYWAYWLRQELLSWAVDYMQKVGTLGLLIFWYEEGNPTAKAAAEKAAAEASVKAALAISVPPGTGGKSMGVEPVSASTAGIDTLFRMIAEWVERHIEAYIVGQSLSSSPEGSGLGGSGVAGLHADTKFNIVKGDADDLEETLTSDLIEPAKRFNYPDADFPVYFRFSVPSPESDKKLDAAEKAWSMGCTLKEEQVMELAGLAMPGPGDRTISNQPAAVPGTPGQPPTAPGNPPPQGWWGGTPGGLGLAAPLAREGATPPGTGPKPTTPLPPSSGQQPPVSRPSGLGLASHYDFDPGKHPRGQPGNAGQFGPGGTTSQGRKSSPSRARGASKRQAEPQRRPLSARKANVPSGGRRAAKLTTVARRRRVLHAWRNESELARELKGHNLPDSEPADVVFVVGPDGQAISHPDIIRHNLAVNKYMLAHGKDAPYTVHAVEVKTFAVQPQGRIRMSPKAKERKEKWGRAVGATWHTVVFDDRKGSKNSGQRLYHANGVGGFKIADMAGTNGFAELAAKVHTQREGNA